jgi:hypothetical protein
MILWIRRYAKFLAILTQITAIHTEKDDRNVHYNENVQFFRQ